MGCWQSYMHTCMHGLFIGVASYWVVAKSVHCSGVCIRPLLANLYTFLQIKDLDFYNMCMPDVQVYTAIAIQLST